MAVRTFATGAGGVKSRWVPFIFLAPYLVLTCVFFIYPFFNGLPNCCSCLMPET